MCFCVCFCVNPKAKLTMLDSADNHLVQWTKGRCWEWPWLSSKENSDTALKYHSNISSLSSTGNDNIWNIQSAVVKEQFKMNSKMNKQHADIYLNKLTHMQNVHLDLKINISNKIKQLWTHQIFKGLIMGMLRQFAK